MRAIKFRAYKKAERKIIEVATVRFMASGGIFVHPKPYDATKKIAIGKDMGIETGNVLMQFTGLTLFGDDLYEGDVITSGEYNYTIEFERGTFILKHTRKNLGNWGPASRMFDADMKGLSFRRVGNIYENPKLLTP